MPSKFTHLHVHSEYSLLDGLSKIPALVKRAKDLGMDSIALTDHGGMYGAIEFYKACREAEIKPIIGIETYITNDHKQKKNDDSNPTNHLILIAKDFEGYLNLCRLSTIANLEGFYYRPRIDKKLLRTYSKGILALSGCNSGEVSSFLTKGNYSGAKKAAMDYIDILGKENFFLEVQSHEFDKFLASHEVQSPIYQELSRMAKEEKVILAGVKKLSKELGVLPVATNDIHYIYQEDALAQDALICISTGKNLVDTNRLRLIDSPTYFLKSAKEMEKLFEDWPEVIKNSNIVASKINLELPIGKFVFPNFEIPKNETYESVLEKNARVGLKKRIPKSSKEINERLEYELSVIIKKGYASYFLIVADFVNWARFKGIISTTRGSASGSLVSYSLGITTVNPLDFKLPFERFLNPYRPSLPDIDIDIADNRRDEVIEYVKKKYGREKVAQIGTFGRMMARAAARDVARVLGWPYAQADRIAKMIPFGSQGFPMTISQSKTSNPDLGQMYKSDQKVKELLDLAEKIEGNARHVSVHAAGVVIAPLELTNYIPLQKETGGENIITQFDMHSVEDAGLVKMDFLGIRNLSILGNAVEIVKKTKKININLDKIPLDDKRAFEMLAKGETIGLFQLGGAGMTRYLKELRPTSVFDIMAMIALFRPGPMNSIPSYIKRKHGEEEITYLDPKMESILKNSYGVITYQDDMLMIAIDIAGYNWETVDQFRKAVGKKIPKEMAKQKDIFISGCIKYSKFTKAKAEKLWSLFEPFQGYGFNKAHAASYAMVAYQTAYMKANYPVEFMTAVMSAESGDAEKISAAISECQKLKIPVLPPDINKSFEGFTIEKKDANDVIRFGISAIKNVGEAAIKVIIEEREKHGGFKSLKEFCQRANLRTVNRKTLESLIKAGAMDLFGNRNSMLKALDDIKREGISVAKKVSEGQTGLFGDDDFKVEETSASSKVNDMEEVSKEEMLSWERELLGFYLTEHPLSQILPLLSSKVSHKISDLKEDFSYKGDITIGGIITQVRRTFTKTSNSQMAFIRVEDDTSGIEIVVFPRLFETIKEEIEMDNVVIITGKLDLRDDSTFLLAQTITRFEPNQVKRFESPESNFNFEVKLPQTADRVLIAEIYQILKQYPGNLATSLVVQSTDGIVRKIPLPFKADPTEDLIISLERLGCSVFKDEN
ncbi:MAG TPA: DNA polymerase III subunit alpha [Patescibacteria group bacterium]